MIGAKARVGTMEVGKWNLRCLLDPSWWLCESETVVSRGVTGGGMELKAWTPG